MICSEQISITEPDKHQIQDKTLTSVFSLLETGHHKNVDITLNLH